MLVVGSTLLLTGAAMLILPGPGLLVIPLGLGVLAIEFAWARRWLARIRGGARRAQGHLDPSAPAAADGGRNRTAKAQGGA